MREYIFELLYELSLLVHTIFYSYQIGRSFAEIRPEFALVLEDLLCGDSKKNQKLILLLYPFSLQCMRI
jgi:hypothetical protein